MNSFWWGHGGATNRGIHWLSWDKLSVHKVHGGMGFKDLLAFNLAMLGKQGWRFQTEPDSLVARLFKARYFPTRSYLTARLGHNPSYVWRSILQSCFIVRGGARWRIGTGTNIPILDEPWLKDGRCISSNLPGADFVCNFCVDSLIDNDTKCWDTSLVQQVFSEEIASNILNTLLVAQVAGDRLIWKAEHNGVYSVKSVYRLYVEDLVDTTHLHRPGFWTGIWKLKVPPKVKNLIWGICRGVLLTRIRLQDKGVQCPDPLC